MSHLVVRPATPDDLPGVAAIYTHYVLNTVITFNTQVVPPAAWLTKFQKHIVEGPYTLLVAAIGGHVVGFIETGPFRPKQAYNRSVEITVYVSPDGRGSGVGTALFAELTARLDADPRFHRALSLIALPNDASIAIHEKFGFVHRGTLTEVGHKFGGYIDVAYYERPLGPPT